MSFILDHFDALTSRGLQVIPLRENSKVPLIKGWTENWDKSVSRDILLRFPTANIGLLLGNVVDVEGDSNEANEIILSLIGNYPHPSYRSTKSIHHLFLSPDPQLRHFHWQKIEFRGFGHQSVLPPSQHAGVRYQWLEHFKFPIPEMPERLVRFYETLSRGKLMGLKPGHMRVWCGACGEKVLLNQRRFKLELEAFKLLGTKWECHKCRTIDLRSACRLIRSGLPKKQILINGFRDKQHD